MTLPEPESFLSGQSGSVTGRRAGLQARARDALLDMRLAASGTGPRFDRLARNTPSRRVLVLSIYREGGGRLAPELLKLEGRHDVRFRFGAIGAAVPHLAAHTVETDLGGGKFPNLNKLLAHDTGHEHDWVLVMDDDVRLPRRFLDRFLALCESFDLMLAQPAQTLTSHAAWPVARRQAGTLVRETRFVEIGPVTAFRREAAMGLMPFPELRFGWGLDLHWSALAAERGWRLGIVDALPVEHTQATVASSYSWEDARDEAQRFLADKPYVDARSVEETLARHRKLRSA